VCPITGLKWEPFLSRREIIVITNEEMRNLDFEDWMGEIKRDIRSERIFTSSSISILRKCPLKTKPP
jgi:hypothetical protein